MCIRTPVLRGIAIEWVELQSFFECFTTVTPTTFKSVERYVGEASLSDICLCLSEPILLLFEIFLSGIVDKSDNLSLFIDCDKSCTFRYDGINIWNALLVKFRVARVHSKCILKL